MAFLGEGLGFGAKVWDLTTGVQEPRGTIMGYIRAPLRVKGFN